MLYHYTTLETLLAILQNANVQGNPENYIVLRATHAYYLNDSKEAKLLTEALKICDIPENVIKTCELLNGYPYVFSLSSKEDDLNMWRGYANNAVGVAIGFEQGSFANINKWQIKSLDEYSFVQCEYTTSEDIASKLKQSEDIQTLIKAMRNNAEIHDVTVVSRILLGMMKYQHKAFCEEEEWRIVINSGFDESYRAAANTLIPYKEFRVPLSAIKSITLGPKVDVDKTSFSIIRIFKQLGIQDLDIIPSCVPYQ